jgi:hypothetical protein
MVTVEKIKFKLILNNEDENNITKLGIMQMLRMECKQLQSLALSITNIITQHTTKLVVLVQSY